MTHPESQAERAMREQFEAEVQKINPDPELLERWPGGQYKHRTIGGYWEGWKIACAAMAAPTVKESLTIPPGWKLVPIEPTEAMVYAAEDVPALRPYGAVYRAMLAAAPQPPEDA